MILSPVTLSENTCPREAAPDFDVATTPTGPAFRHATASAHRSAARRFPVEIRPASTRPVAALRSRRPTITLRKATLEQTVTAIIGRTVPSDNQASTPPHAAEIADVVLRQVATQK